MYHKYKFRGGRVIKCLKPPGTKIVIHLYIKREPYEGNTAFVVQ